MTSLKPEFKLLERGFKELLVLVPGWAMDYRIFGPLNLPYNYLIPVKFKAPDFQKELSAILDNLAVDKISLLGWSSGGFLATDFALKNAERVSELILISIRRRYIPKRLEEIKGYLKRNKKAYLYRFYLDCFSRGETEEISWFKKNLFKNYIREAELSDLLEGLDYLSCAAIVVESLSSLALEKPIRFFHGQEDQIAPFQEAWDIASGVAKSKFISFPGVGHMPFLNSAFQERAKNG